MGVSDPIAYTQLSSGPISCIMVPDQSPNEPIHTFGAVLTPEYDPSGFLTSGGNAILSPGYHPDVFGSSASLSQLEQITIFHTRVDAEFEACTCTGVFLEYFDGTTASLGTYGGDIVESVVAPTAIHFKALPHGNLVRCSSETSYPTEADIVDGPWWRTQRLVGEVEWWYDNYRTFGLLMSDDLDDDSN